MIRLHLSLYGDYCDELSKDSSCITQQPKRGYAKSGRHDLKQMILLLATTGSSNFSIWMESHSGNKSDQKTLPSAAKRMQSFCKKLKEKHDFIYVGDSAIYANILQYSDEMLWISRVPERIKSASDLVEINEQDITWTKIDDDYSFSEYDSQYGKIKQRWIMIFSKMAYKKECKTLNSRIEKEYIEQLKNWKKLSNQTFSCENDAEKEAQKQTKKMKYHQAHYEIQKIKQYPNRGKPAKGTKPLLGYQVKFNIFENKEKIAKSRNKKGRFILATNQVNDSMPHVILKEYKAQSGVERGFKFIKDNSYH